MFESEPNVPVAFTISKLDPNSNYAVYFGGIRGEGNFLESSSLLYCPLFPQFNIYFIFVGLKLVPSPFKKNVY